MEPGAFIAFRNGMQMFMRSLGRTRRFSAAPSALSQPFEEL
jgi:hypothetical protein